MAKGKDAKADKAKAAPAAEGEAAGKKKGGKKKLMLLALVPLLLGGAGAGVFFSGVLDPPPTPEESDVTENLPPPGPPIYVDLPEIVVNLNAPGRRASFIKVRSRLEVPRPEDASLAQAAMPRLLDLFTTYLREIRPEELRGSIGTQRLREELLARATIAMASQQKPGGPAPRVNDVLFVEILQQ